MRHPRQRGHGLGGRVGGMCARLCCGTQMHTQPTMPLALSRASYSLSAAWTLARCSPAAA
eukprot:355127-Chlamydomonas_euryale.AAC.11